MMFAGRICTFVGENAARWNEWKVEKPNSADAGKRLGKNASRDSQFELD